jgi:REP element-mobilizing transposase RayT
MPNHVHLLLDTTNYNQMAESNRAGTTRYYPLTDTLRLLKGRTARACNLALNRAGAFWQHESHDHVVRNENSYVSLNARIRISQS